MHSTPHAPPESNQDPRFAAPESKILLTVEEAADRLSLGRTSVFALIAANEIRSVKIGKARRIVASSLHDYVAAKLADVS
ncbi:excisionase family DNA-binding protein [Nocardiopsis alba]|uniref:excisionase family DNA-binding protein n=1 Tax=Nocardiopsis alba TaxID=53437 RepID=UPI00366E2772